ncbi:hypothetical protein FRZ44_42700 [Hypericibacter terrae]|uniref:Cadherin domain-containing protein n=1 Tax=Hypericibacter terrae TaxID=2602015 RepID=A0A5J6MN19_9PROT|nr:Calx-beta domain-containing protein [Hypericibacter terrae]QEX18958.1 hypothetical protein FRZ44_42700 [Hypericibacter terrae]
MLTEGTSGDNGLTSSDDARESASLVLDARSFDGKLPWPAEALLHADFVHLGDDLVVHLANGETVLIQHYFSAAQPVELVSFDGALVPGWLVGLLSAPSVPTQLAQGTETSGLGDPIGEVHAITGSATVTHPNGVTGPLAVGSPIYLNDIVETGDGSAINIQFVDKTTFALADNGRIAIDKLIYDPAGSDNGLGISVVTGAFVFITGAIAPASGDGMVITTPAGSIGIRGTTGGGDVTPEGAVKAWVVQDNDPEQESITFTDNTGHSYKLSEAGSTIDFTSPNSPPSLSVQPGDTLLKSVGTIQSVVPSITHTLTSPDNNQPHQEQPQEQQKGENDQPGDQGAAQASQFETAAGSPGSEGSGNVAGDSGSGNFAFFSPTGVAPEGETGALSGTDEGPGSGSAGGGALGGGGSGSGGSLPPTAGSPSGPQFEVLPPPSPPDQNEPPPPPPDLVDTNGTGDQIAEAAATGAPVGITVNAPQLTGTVTYSLTDDAGGRFAINPNTGVVTVADGALLNSEAATSHSITAQATNGSDTVARSFTVTIADLPPSTPVDSDADANSVAENAANGTTVALTAQATDPNGGSVTYSLTNNAGGRFAIDSATGVVTVANGALLDHEAAASHDITVHAADPFGAASEQTFTIGVADVNEPPGVPTDANPADNQVAENAANGAIVGVTALAIDPDGDTVTYSLTDDAGGRFAIDPTSGVVTVANGALLDFESATSHVITVQASSSGTSPSTQNFTIAVADQNPEAGDVTNLHWSISGQSQLSEGANAVYTVSYSGATLLPGVTETITVATGAAPSGSPDAIGGSDYATVNMILTFTGGGPTAQTLSLATVDDTLVESSEDYAVQLSGPSHGTVASGTVSTVILDDDASNLSWSIVGQTQVDEGADATYTVGYSGAALAPGQTASVTVQTGAAGGGAPNAIGGSDYNNANIVLTFTAGGATAQTLTVHTVDDTLVEGTEDYQVTIGPVSSGSIVAATAATNILDNDASSLVWTLSGATQVGEGATAVYTVSYGGAALAPGQSAFATLQTGSGAATEAVDFASRDGFVLTFTGGGPLNQTVNVTTLQDTLLEGTEGYQVTLGSVSAGSVATATVFTEIVDDDASNLAWSIAGQAQVVEGNVASYTVSYAGAVLTPGQSVVVTVATGPGTNAGTPDAVSGTDYTALDVVLTFSGGGPTAQTVSVQTSDDTVVEGTADYSVQLSGPSAGAIAVGTAGTDIVDNDGGGLLWSLTGASAVDEGGDAVYTVGYAGAGLAPGQTAVVTIETGIAAGATPDAISGSDYTAVNLVLTFTGGDPTAQTLALHTSGDSLVEGTEDYQVAISGPSSGLVVSGTAVTAIVDDDASNLLWSLTGQSQVNEAADAIYTVGYSGATLAVGQSATITVATGTAAGGASDATAGADYTSLTQVLTFTGGGPTTQTVLVHTQDDTQVESTEDYQVQLSGQSSGTIAQPTAATNILDNDASGLQWSMTGTTQLTEGADGAYTVSYTGATLAVGQTATVTVATETAAGGAPDATAGVDYTSLTQVLTFTGGGATAQTVAVHTQDDTQVEGTEDYQVQISGQGSGTIAQPTATTNLVDNDASNLQWTITGTTQLAEGADGTYTVSYTGVTLDAGQTATITVATGTAAGGAPDATAGVDYTSLIQVLTFTGGGATAQTVSVHTQDDTQVEGTEDYQVQLSGQSSGAIAQPTATTNILDNDASGLQWSVTGTTQLTEGADGTYTVSYTGATLAVGQTATITVGTGSSTGNGTPDATAGVDFTSLTQVLTFTGGGSTAQTVSVHTQNDTQVESTEDYQVQLSGQSSGTIVNATVTTNILDNDASSLQWSITGTTQLTEGADGTYTVAYSGATLALGQSATVMVATGSSTGNGTPDATAGTDYTSVAQVLTFTGGGSTAQTVSVHTQNDTQVESTEDYQVQLSGQSSGSIAQPTATTNILDNDASSLQWSITGTTQLTEGADGTYTVAYSGATLAAGQTAFVTVQTGTAAGGAPNATGGSDYNNVNTVLTFAGGGTTAQTLTVHTNNDTVVEPNEDYQVALGVVSIGTVAVGTVTTDIIDDDGTNLAWAITGSAQVNEGVDASYTVSYAGAALATGVTASITVATGLAPGGASDAVSGVDFDAVTTVLTFTGGGATLQTLTVHAIADTEPENTEDFSVVISGASPGSIETGTVTTEIPGGVTGSEVLRGTANANSIQGHDGDDWIQGLAGDDTLQGGPGADTLIGGSGNDGLDGGPDADLYYHSGYLSDGFDTIENATAGDVVTFTGGPFFFDVNFDRVGNDLVIGSAIDDNYDFADTGSVTIKDHYAGSPIEKFTIDLGFLNNAYYNDTSLTGLDYAVFVTPGGLIGSDQGAFAEILQGSAAADVILGNGGYHDEIYGGGGDDSIVAGDGNDWLVGNADNDTIDGGNGDDNLQGRDGNDVLIGGNGFDLVWYHRATAGVTASLAAGGASDDGQGGTDSFTGIEGLIGSTHDDNLAGDGNGNWLEGRNGNDTLAGGGGGDTLIGGEGNDSIDGGGGADLYFHSGFMTDGFDTIANATAGDAVIFTGSGFFDLNYDRIGNDLVIGSAVDSNYDFADTGSVTIKNHYAGAAIDRFTINLGYDDAIFYNDPSVVGSGNVTVLTPAGLTGTDQGDYAEILQGTGGGETLLGNGGYHDEIFGYGGNDSIVAGWGNDWLVGSQGDDTVNGGNGDDILQGREGADLLIGGNGFDFVYYNRATVGVVANLLTGGASNDGYGGIDSYVSIEGLRGSEQADNLTGNTVNNRLEGRGGDDTLGGGGGGDTLVGGAGNDLSDGGAGADVYLHSGYLDDGFDTIENATAGDTVAFTGGPFYYDFHYQRVGDDLVIGSAVDGNYDFGETGSVTVRDQYAGAAIDGFSIDLGYWNNAWYNDLDQTGLDYTVFVTPGGLVGTDQGAYAELLPGTDGSDTILGNGGYYDNVWAGDGDDSIVAGWGHDWLVGEGGDDTILAGEGDDILQGRAGNDILNGEGGFDLVYYDQAPGDVVASIIAGGAGADGYGGTDTYVSIEGIVGSDYNDNVVGDGGINRLQGGFGDDTLTGGGDSDTILGGGGADLLLGGAGADWFVRAPGEGDDIIVDADGADVLQFDPDSYVYDIDWWRDGNDLWIAGVADSTYDWALDGSVRIEDQYAGSGHGIAHVEADLGADNLWYGNDPSISIIFTPTGLIGGAQGAWSELITGDFTTATDDVISGGGAATAAETETVEGSYRDLMSGGAGDDTIYGSSNLVDLGGDTIVGGDWMSGNDGDDVLYAGGGDDTLRGDAGNDLLDGGGGTDEVRYHLEAGGVTVNLSDAAIIVGLDTLAAGTAIDSGGGIDTLVSIEDVRGSHQTDYIQGSAVANVLNGLEGDDTILGGAGDDTIQGGSGANVIAPGDGSDLVDLGAFDSSADRVEYRDGAISGTDVIQGFNADDQDQIDLDGLFDALGTATVDRGINSGYQFQNGNELWVNTDGNTGNGFEVQIATVQVTSGILDAGDVAVGTL